MNPALLATLTAGLADGSIVPYLGPGVLADVRSVAGGAPMPADSDSLILALNDGRPMAPKLMYEFPRAAMNVELKRGRAAVTRFLDRTYGATAWTRAAVHDWLAALRPRYVVDINRDTQLQDSYAGVPHQLVVGVARMGGSAFRYRLYGWDGAAYAERAALDPALPILFKPMGTPRPAANYIASDADYVDYITELMGGFAIPPELKALRRGKRYLLLGMRLNRDTERMVLADIIHGAASPAGWIVLAAPSDKERRFCRKLGLEIVEGELAALTGVRRAAPEAA
ncbi:SIR2 family protein [Azospira restricta]|uniref:SIR2 family protein n=1 Tax=Azospira restricta TaxID=404405 RepID=A0A974SRC4_9RHOO|nr:SIR2 family protein [Azospira restricta]QRJ64982.1 SIR2 family protein [Azospira restricta]